MFDFFQEFHWQVCQIFPQSQFKPQYRHIYVQKIKFKFPDIRNVPEVLNAHVNENNKKNYFF